MFTGVFSTCLDTASGYRKTLQIWLHQFSHRVRSYQEADSLHCIY